MTFDEWFEIQPHPAMSEQEIAEMRRDYKYAWDAALKHARPEARAIEALQTVREMIRGQQIEHRVVNLDHPDIGLGQWLDSLLAAGGESK